MSEVEEVIEIKQNCGKSKIVNKASKDNVSVQDNSNQEEEKKEPMANSRSDSQPMYKEECSVDFCLPHEEIEEREQNQFKQLVHSTQSKTQNVNKELYKEMQSGKGGPIVMDDEEEISMPPPSASDRKVLFGKNDVQRSNSFDTDQFSESPESNQQP